MGLKAAIQALQKADQLKEKVQRCSDLLKDNEAWICQQRLRRIYQQVLILDLEYALDRKVEQDLWSHGFKNYIATLQALAKDKKNLKRSESQAMLSWCLEAASGFYLTLLQDICTAFDLDLPFRRNGSVFGSGKPWKATEELNPPHHSSCNYICQHCLVHLGDIARYRGQNRQAEAFYRHAVLPAPSNGHPYNQLALLEASRGDRLGTVFHYVRSIAVRCPFQAAATNLQRTLNKSVEEKLSVEGRTKLSASEYVSAFIHLHGLLHLNAELDTAERLARLLNTTLTAHIATEGLTSWKLVQMLVINLFALLHAGGCTDANTITAFPDEQLSCDERRVKRIATDVVAGSLAAFLLPVYTLKDLGETLLEYFALPAIKLTLDWIRLEPSVLSDSAFTSRLQIWPSLCKLLNGLRAVLGDLDTKKYGHVPLPEDRDLQCFLPLEPALVNLRFSSVGWTAGGGGCSGDRPSAAQLRASRLLAFGDWLAARDDCRLIVKGAEEAFEAVGGQQVPPSDLIRELEELSLTKLSSPAPSEGSSWGSSATGSSTPDNLLAVAAQGPPSPPEQVPQPVDTERRAGILKPQGSLEKSREKEQLPPSTGNVSVPVARRGRQNVAMSAILRRAGAEHESKQVTFKSPSPTPTAPPPPAEGGGGGGKAASWQHQQHHQKLQLQFKQQQQQQAQMQQLKQQQQQQQQSVHYPFQTPPPPIQHPPQNPNPRHSIFTCSSESTQIQHPASFGSPFLTQIPFHQPPPAVPQAPDKHYPPLGQSYAAGSPLLPAQQYSPWQQSANEGSVPSLMQPTVWCAADSRRVSRPPGMDRSAVPSSLASSNPVFPGAEDRFSGWGVRQTPGYGAVHHSQAVGDHAAFGSQLRDNEQMSAFGAQPRGNEQMSAFGGQPRGSEHMSAFGAQLRDSEENVNVNAFSAGLGAFSSVGAGNTYSLFSSPAWAATPGIRGHPDGAGHKADVGVIGGQAAMGQQSLWSGPGPSPLERLLEQQKQLREGPAPMGGT